MLQKAAGFLEMGGIARADALHRITQVDEGDSKHSYSENRRFRTWAQIAYTFVEMSCNPLPSAPDHTGRVRGPRSRSHAALSAAPPPTDKIPTIALESRS